MNTKHELRYDAIGIDSELRVFGGYDEDLTHAYSSPPDWMYDEEIESWSKSKMSNKERLAIADTMIQRWTKYREAVLNEANA